MQTRKINIVFVFSGIIMFLILNSCKKEELICSTFGFTKNLIWEDSGCDESFEQPPTGDEFRIQEGNQFMYPAFNPNDPYEFVYYQIAADSGSQLITGHHLMKFNYKTGVKTKLLDNVEIVGHPAWNLEGWIAFKTINAGFLYIVRDDGSQLSQFSKIPYGNLDNGLTWLNGSNTLLWGGGQANGTSFINTKTIGDQDKKQIYFNSGVFNIFMVSPNNILIADNASNYYVTIDLNLDSLYHQLRQFNHNGSPYGKMNWHVDGRRFYMSFVGSLELAGLFEIDFPSGEVSRLIRFCDKEVIKEAICSPLGDKLILQKTDRTLIPGPDPTVSIGGYLIENSSLWLFDLETRKETRLPLD
jgi:hypothetical protein